MKVETSRDGHFQPVTVSITLETQREADALFNVVNQGSQEFANNEHTIAEYNIAVGLRSKLRQFTNQ